MEKIELMNEWSLQLKGPGDFEIVNLGEGGEKRFFAIVPGRYCPLIQEEPDLAYSLSLSVENCVDAMVNPVSPQMKMKGIIVKETKGVGGKVLYRANMTNFLGRDSGVLDNGGATILVNGSRYRLYRLVAENKNRILGYIGFYMPEDSTGDKSPIEILEVEDLG